VWFYWGGHLKILILAGGFGTRLKSAVSNVPKAMAPIGGIPFLQLQIEHWRAQGLNDFSFLLHHQADQIIDFLQLMQEGPLMGCQVKWLTEPLPMDTGGAVAYAVKELCLNENFLVTNADTWLGGGVHDLVCAPFPAIAIVNRIDVSRYGLVHFDQSNKVTAFLEKNALITDGWINAGLCHLSSSQFKDWDGQPFSLERDFFPKLVKNQSLTVVPLNTDFIDIGIPGDYYKFCRWIESGKKTSL
jgi:D-glycero-alpha-D-manno-heptose 1-phosphate guanylyltransferase